MVPSVLYLRGKRLKYAPGYPIYHPRLVRRETVGFVRNHTGHGEAVLASSRVATADIATNIIFTMARSWLDAQARRQGGAGNRAATDAGA